jgi:hypothetical protein
MLMSAWVQVATAIGIPMLIIAGIRYWRRRGRTLWRLHRAK